ncbi:glycoside hydrolase family 38 C-terminal domain-containing protein [Paenibacillus sp. LHD-117]|uniref:alpha-mannosidase n=1 Tax=Paenibacillus sp. LHD-117 TaxID=3071412 RepID=UPI0027DF98FA|nr:glycoside hydrolase family 38 C-terminal domain-containing protein [Paenibacillus sp. LHD-117]MDQ6419079.1 glycoside hydrolase family 38 C-terminal domain-containing protein [Paenibacillus sp. LHD-117]
MEPIRFAVPIAARKGDDGLPYESLKPDHGRRWLEKISENIYEKAADLSVTAWVTPEPVPYEERTNGRKLERLSEGDRWGQLWDCAWFHFSGKVPDSAKGNKVVLLIDVNGELCLVDEEGTPVQGLTNINSEFDYSLGKPGKRVVHITEVSEGTELIDLWGDAGCNDLFGRFRSGTLKEATIAVCREEIRQLYYDAEVLLETAEQLPESSARRAQILQALYEASFLLREFTEEEAAKARALLEVQLAKKGGAPALTVSAVGHAHIDLAWLWPIRETIRKGARTFSTALRMMERYPDYVFGASQPQLYDWMKTHYPKLYEKIKKRVKEGRWEPQGAMWVESDTNVPGGESLVRQLLYGKRYFLQEFGQEMKSLWMPDVFGYTASLPQLLRKSGVDYMMTQKLSWSEYNQHPHHTFHWEGIDGSKVLTHMPPEDTYNSPAAPRSIAKAEHNYLDKNVSDRCLMLFGIGDGGGGPGEEHLERLARETNLLGLSPVEQESSHRFFERLNEGSDKYRTWQGELYLEKHQGTLTSQARNKRYNRFMEKALRELEFASSLAGIIAGAPYPAEELETIWKETLLYQFHDILPGSSIKRVYDESLERYAIMLARVEDLIAGAYGEIAARLPDADGSGKRQAVFNSLPWEREEWMKLNGSWRKVRVPAMGYVAIAADRPEEEAEKQSAAALAQHEDAANRLIPMLGAAERIVENELLRVAFGENGAIRSIVDKAAGREVVASGEANALAVYEDDGDAWDFRHDYRDGGGAPPTLLAMEPFADGPTAGMLLRYEFGQSVITQKVILTMGSRRIDFETEADWRESGRMLRTSFPVAVRSDAASCEIQFGYVKRPTHRNTSWDFAKDEICAHHWIDLSEPDYGVALLNDSKYGHRVCENVLDLNLLRGATYPDPEADIATHRFTYSLYPHEGDHVQAQVYKRGYELNVPLRTVAAEPAEHGGSLPASASFLRADHPNVMIEAVKRAEDGEELIVRLYETSGTRARTTLNIGVPVTDAWLTDLLEQPSEKLALTDGALSLTLLPFEVVTLKLALRS